MHAHYEKTFFSVPRIFSRHAQLPHAPMSSSTSLQRRFRIRTNLVFRRQRRSVRYSSRERDFHRKTRLHFSGIPPGFCGRPEFVQWTLLARHSGRSACFLSIRWIALDFSQRPSGAIRPVAAALKGRFSTGKQRQAWNDGFRATAPVFLSQSKRPFHGPARRMREESLLLQGPGRLIDRVIHRLSGGFGFLFTGYPPPRYAPP